MIEGRFCKVKFKGQKGEIEAGAFSTRVTEKLRLIPNPAGGKPTSDNFLPALVQNSRNIYAPLSRMTRLVSDSSTIS